MKHSVNERGEYGELEKKAVTGIMLALLLTGILSLIFNIQPVKASGAIYIRADGLVDPPTAPIQRNGDIYTLTSNICDSIVVERDNVVVDGASYTLQGAGIYLSKGIDLSGRNNITIMNTKIRSFYYGIYLRWSYGNDISGNNITNNEYGIHICEFSSYNNIFGNQITNNGGYGIVFMILSDYNSISGNNITNNGGDGVQLYIVSHSSIFGNQITNNGRDGIFGYCLVRNASISGNQITNNGGDGVQLDEGSGNISGNQITNNGGDGIDIFNAYDCGISGNQIANNGGDGIRLAKVGYMSISENIVTANTYGIRLADSWRTNVFGNTIAYNELGTVVGVSREINIYHNNFVNNVDQAVMGWGSATWDDGYPSGGNYWSDHIAVDKYSGINQENHGSDGIVDEPYIIDDYHRDNYPLIEPWSPRPPPQEDLEELTETIKSWNLPKGTESSLTSKLEEAIFLLDKGNENGAIHKLMDFINQVEALREEKLTNEQADFATEEAELIIALIKG